MIAVVDDDALQRAMLRDALVAQGFAVEAFAGGEAALARLAAVAPRLVVSDVVMPELDGPSLLRELRKTRPELKIIFVSGYAEDAFKKNLPDGEIFSFLPKPFSLNDLTNTVQGLLS